MIKKKLKLLLKQTALYGYIAKKLKITLPICVINFIVQRIFRVNGKCPWSVNYTSRVTHPDRIKLGRDVDIYMAVSGHCYIAAANGIEIGDGTIFAPGVKIISANHDLSDYNKSVKTRPISIGKHCWLGTNSVILPGVTLGDNVIVGAGSVVTKSFPDNCIIAGVPAKIIRKLDDTKRNFNDDKSPQKEHDL